MGVAAGRAATCFPTIWDDAEAFGGAVVTGATTTLVAAAAFAIALAAFVLATGAADFEAAEWMVLLAPLLIAVAATVEEVVVVFTAVGAALEPMAVFA